MRISIEKKGESPNLVTHFKDKFINLFENRVSIKCTNYTQSEVRGAIYRFIGGKSLLTECEPSNNESVLLCVDLILTNTDDPMQLIQDIHHFMQTIMGLKESEYTLDPGDCLSNTSFKNLEFDNSTI